MQPQVKRKPSELEREIIPPSSVRTGMPRPKRILSPFCPRASVSTPGKLRWAVDVLAGEAMLVDMDNTVVFQTDCVWKTKNNYFTRFCLKIITAST